MWLDLIGLAFLAAFMLAGLLRGTLASFLRILSLALAYGCAIWAAPRFGPAVSERLAVPAFLGLPIAGALGFMGSYVLLSVISKLIQVWDRRRLAGDDRTAVDRLGGAILGGIQGGVLMLLVGWLGLFIDAGRASGGLEMLPDTSDSALKGVSQTVIAAGAQVFADDSEPGTRVAINMVARPKETMENMDELLGNPRIQGLQEDQLFWSHVENGSVDAALNQGSFLGIAYDDTLREELADIGLIPDHAAKDPRLFRNEAREVFEEIGPRLHGIKNDPEVRALLQDPDVVAALESGDHLSLLRNPGFRSLVSRVLEGDPSQN